jgi:MFS family permease
MIAAERGSFGSSAAPLKRPTFRRLWIASVISNVGGWMHDVAEAWLMTSLTAAPLYVALLQAAESVTVFLLALPAGAFADVVDRRTMLVITQVWMALSATTLGILTLTGHASPSLLLLFALIMGIGSAVNTPVWQSTLPDLVGRDELPAAVTLNGVGFNVARLIGPAIGGALVASVGSGPVFLINGASFLAVISAVILWRRTPKVITTPPERVACAMIAGMRYVRHSPPLHAVFLRSTGFVVFGSSLWPLLPVLARRSLGLGSGGYGLLVGFLGLGASSMVFALPRVRQRLGVDRNDALEWP